MRTVCRTAVDAAHYSYDKLYDYFVPERLNGTLKPGMRVQVPFGAGNRKIEAMVLGLDEAPDDAPLKEVCAVLDDEPVLDESLRKLAAWMCSSLFCTFYACARAMLPAGLWFRREEVYTLSDALTKETLALHAAAEPVLGLFSMRKKSISAREIRRKLGEIPTQAVQRLCETGLLQVSSRFSRKIGDRTVKMYALSLPAEEAMARAEKGRSPVRMDIVSCLSNEDAVSAQELTYLTGCTTAMLSSMVKQGTLTCWQEETFRMPEESVPEKPEPLTLSDAQRAAYEGLEALLLADKPEAALLFGVTGSGKTQVYLRLIARTLQQGRGALVLVPEIGLTPQMIRRFRSYFGDLVTVLHSGLSVGERYDSWKRIRSGAARVVVGTRSAVFAPVKNLGLLVLDEEQDDAYKSEQNPRYHARDVAKYRAMQQRALLVLGSATPSIETFYGAQSGKYPMFRLDERYAGTALPQVSVCDMRGSVREGYNSSVGPDLRNGIAHCLERKEQSILFLNRRGAARQVTCMACGWTPECPSCSVSMTYHSVNRRVMCHYCGHSERLAARCPVCGSTHLKTEGTGTQRVEEELRELFPEARILRMDADSTARKNARQKLLAQFGAGEADLLLGTQMVTKGLDFDRVTLVGVIDADQALFAQDYRAHERAFSLLTQVVGRAGRRSTQGHALIQTYCPEHSVLLDAGRQDYEAFYAQEIAVRQALQCPPAAQLLLLTGSAERERDVLEAMVQLKQRIESLMAGQFADFCYPVLGPAPATIVRMQNRYRYHLTIRCPDNRRRRELIRGVLREFSADRRFHTVALYADINPLDV